MSVWAKRSIAILAVAVIAAVFAFVFPGITGGDPHLRADKEFLEGLNCEFGHDYECADSQYRKAISIYTGDSRYYTHLARLQRLQGNYAESIETYKQAKEIDPSNESVLPGLNMTISQQATQTAMPADGLPLEARELKNPPLPESIYPIFDEEFGIVEGVAAMSGEPDDHIAYEIVDSEAYSGRYSLLVTWTKKSLRWAGILLWFESSNDPLRAANGQMRSIDLVPPSDYAIQFFAKRGEASTISPLQQSSLMDKSITLKFQDQNILITESIGNQAVYIYDYDSDHPHVPDGRLKLSDGDWQEFCLPLERFDTDRWIDLDYQDFPEADRQFNWSNVKQINIDADFISTEGAIYIDAMRIIRASDCTPYP
jgi:hypothetical protein